MTPELYFKLKFALCSVYRVKCALCSVYRVKFALCSVYRVKSKSLSATPTESFSLQGLDLPSLFDDNPSVSLICPAAQSSLSPASPACTPAHSPYLIRGPSSGVNDFKKSQKGGGVVQLGIKVGLAKMN